MKSKQTTEKIQQIITDQKQLATRLASALFAAATIGAGVTLTGCDTISTSNNPDTTNEIPGEVPSEEITSEFASEEVTTTEVTEEQTSDVKEITSYESEVLSIITNEYPEFENGVHSFKLTKFNGGAYNIYSIALLPSDGNGNEKVVSYQVRINISKDEYRSLLDKFNLESKSTIYVDRTNLSNEQIEYISKIFYENYIKNLNENLDLEQ